jgi:hypothetical protein
VGKVWENCGKVSIGDKKVVQGLSGLWESLRFTHFIPIVAADFCTMVFGVLYPSSSSYSQYPQRTNITTNYL